MGFLAQLVTAPVRLAASGIRLAEQVADEVMDGHSQPQENSLDRIADTVERDVDKMTKG